MDQISGSPSSPVNTSPTEPSPARSNSMIFILITSMIDAIGFGIMLPVLPQLIKDLTGSDIHIAAIYGGWLMFSYAIMQFFCSPIVGNLSDRFGRRPVLLIALFALGIDYVIMGLAPNILWLFIGRILSGAAGATYSTANAYVADISPPEKRAQNFGLLGAAFGAGFVIGPALGGLLAGDLFKGTFIGDFGVRTPFFAAAFLCLINFLYGFFILKESLPEKDRRKFVWQRSNPLGAALTLKKNPFVFVLLIVLFIFFLGHFSLPSVWSYYTIEKFNWSEQEIGFSLAFAGIIMMIVQGGLIRVAIPKLGEVRSAYLGLTSMIISFFGYAIATQGWHMYAWILAGSFANFSTPAIQGIMSKNMSTDTQGELQGAVASLNGLTAIVGPLVMTGLFGYFSSNSAPIYLPGAPFFVAAILTTVSFLLFISATKKAEKL
ncbi:MAG: TCR/Tet family MFS transporter [Cellvibrionaceae bacterium]